MGRAQLVVTLPDLGSEGLAPLGTDQGAGHTHRPRRIRHMHHRTAIGGRDLHRRVHAAGGGAADQQRQVEALALHLGGEWHI